MTSLSDGKLILDDQLFTKDNLKVTAPTSIKIYTVKGDSQNHYIPDYDPNINSCIVLADSGEIRASNILEDNSGYYVNSSENLTLIVTSSIETYSYSVNSNSDVLLPAIVELAKIGLLPAKVELVEIGLLPVSYEEATDIEFLTPPILSLASVALLPPVVGLVM